MSVKLFASVSLAVWLLTATSTLSQSNRYVLDTNGSPLVSYEEYYIIPAMTDNGGRFTSINRNQSCPLYVGLENTDLPQGYPVRFTPFANDYDVKVNRDLKVEFVEVSSTCVQSTEWTLGENDTRSGRRLIVTGRDDGISSARNYFRIEEAQNAHMYKIGWCPTEVCPICRFFCGTGGILRENGHILFALDGSALPVLFQKRDY
ncbi:hypothetical protein V8G54_024652 [Vigna mungo]|uniref:Uncharacterized protein n=1 Tax=Vigna mungo TaxID=3915 RepID=A0AAQ3N7K8_VIGMU